jgi:ABC-type lipoprotein export system ATPase subunit
VTTSEPIIVCDGLARIYKVAELEVVALQGLDLVVPRGELLGIVGPSGSGKSTLMNILGGLDRPTAGRAFANGHDLLRMSDAERKRYRRTEIGFVWQQGWRNLLPFLDAQRNVEMPLTLLGQSPAEKHRRAMELLEAVGLADRERHRMDQLSGGEQQRVAIAVALAHGPSLLLADEPTGELDSATAASIYDTLRNINRHYGLTTLIVSHDSQLAYHVDRVVSIRDGRLASEITRTAPADFPHGEAAAEQSAFAASATLATLEELAVLDAAGRLQIPRDYLEQHQIGRRVRIEMTEEGILIRPVASATDAGAAGAAEIAPAKKRRDGLRSLLSPGRRKRASG